MHAKSPLFNASVFCAKIAFVGSLLILSSELDSSHPNKHVVTIITKVVRLILSRPPDRCEDLVHTRHAVVIHQPRICRAVLKCLKKRLIRIIFLTTRIGFAPSYSYSTQVTPETSEEQSARIHVVYRIVSAVRVHIERLRNSRQYTDRKPARLNQSGRGMFRSYPARVRTCDRIDRR